jgi:hypothetical protein
MMRWIGALLCAALAATTAQAEPIDQWNSIGPGYDCTNDPYNPIRADGTRDPHGDPVPGSPDWDRRDEEHVACSDQRDHDARPNPLRNVGTAQYGFDEYRQPFRHDGVRFRHEHFSEPDGNQIPDVPSAEIFRPCPTDPTVCPNLPPELERFDPPYPVVVVFHGIIAQKEHHRYTTQALAEAGYMAIGVSGTLPAGGGPNIQRTQNGDDVLRWLAGETSSNVTPEADYGAEADLDRVAFAGHSQGAGASFSYQGDPRVHAIIAWDGGDDFSNGNCALDPASGERVACAPIMYQRTDGDFTSPRTDRWDYPDEDDAPLVFGGPRWRGRAPYEAHVARGMDVFHLTARATVHTDWNGFGVGLAGNRYGELVFNYYNLAWMERHLRGKLAFDANGDVVTYHGRDEAAERAFRQAIANDAFDRLTARHFDDSADKHNISLGFWDPDRAAANPLDPFAGNVPVLVEGLEIRDRHSPYYYGYCAVSVPDYVNGASGRPGDTVPPARTADTGPDGDLRFEGCGETTHF